jgi:hypothetical protein
MMLNRLADLMGKERNGLSRRREPILPHRLCAISGGLVCQKYTRGLYVYRPPFSIAQRSSESEEVLATPSAAYGRNQTMDAFSPSYHCDCLNFTSHEHGRERMQEFTAKYADKIQGF